MFDMLRNLPLPQISVRGTAQPQDPSLGLSSEDPELVLPPWQTQGQVVLELAQFLLEDVQPLVPRDIDIFQTWPGYTLGAVGFISYENSPVGPYHEVVIAPALVAYQGIFSFWISSIDVDSERSLRSGRFNWGLPKHLRGFDYDWQLGSYQVTNDSTTLIKATSTQVVPTNFTLPEWLSGFRNTLNDLSQSARFSISPTMLTAKAGGYYRTETDFSGPIVPVSLKMTANPESEYNLLNRRQPLIAFCCNRSRFKLSAPSQVVD